MQRVDWAGETVISPRHDQPPGGEEGFVAPFGGEMNQTRMMCCAGALEHAALRAVCSSSHGVQHGAHEPPLELSAAAA